MIPWGERYNQSRRLIMREMLKNIINGRVHMTIVDLGAQSVHKLKEKKLGREDNYAISSEVDVTKNNVFNVDVNIDNFPDIVMNFDNFIALKSNSVDICIAGDVIEHLYYSGKFVSEIYRVIKPGGGLLISTPNMVSAFRRIKWLSGGVPNLAAHADLMYGINETAPAGHGHIHDFSFLILSKLLENTGFGITKSITDGIHIKNKLRIPSLIIPKTIGDSIIVYATKQS